MSERLVVALLGGGAALALFLGATGAIDGPRSARRRRLRQFVSDAGGNGPAPRRAPSALVSWVVATAGRPPVATGTGGILGAALAFAIVGPDAVVLGAAGGGLLGYTVPRRSPVRSPSSRRRCACDGASARRNRRARRRSRCSSPWSCSSSQRSSS